MKNYNLRAIGVEIRNGEYVVVPLSTYEAQTSVKQCYEQLKCWAKEYGYLIISYEIKEDITRPIATSRLSPLGVVLPNDKEDFKALVDKCVEKFERLIQENENK